MPLSMVVSNGDSRALYFMIVIKDFFYSDAYGDDIEEFTFFSS